MTLANGTQDTHFEESSVIWNNHIFWQYWYFVKTQVGASTYLSTEWPQIGHNTFPPRGQKTLVSVGEEKSACLPIDKPLVSTL